VIWIKRYGGINISVIPLTVHLDNRYFATAGPESGRDVPVDRKDRHASQDSRANPGEFIEFFRQFSDDIVFIGISSKSSATVQNAPWLPLI
jgi:fatty acid-binding protein DegV